MVREVIKAVESCHRIVRRATHSRAVRQPGGGPEASLEPAPGDAPGIEKVSHIEAVHGDQIPAGREAVFQSGPGVADHGSFHNLGTDVASVSDHSQAMGLARNQVYGTWRRRAERRVERVVAHGE